MVKPLAGRRVLVVGMARSGLAAARFLAAHGALVIATDSRSPAVLQAEVRELLGLKAGIETGVHRAETFLAQDLIVVSPGVPWDLAPLAEARRKGMEVIPEIELAGAYLRGRLIGITGSNGKTTTTVLTAKMLEESGFDVVMAGNVGVPLISVVERLTEDSIVVAELSSFQLEAIRDFHPRVAALLNLSPNHLDRHPTFDAYIQAKAQIFRNQTEDDIAILNADDPRVAALSDAVRSRKIFFSRSRELPEGAFISNREILWRLDGLERVVADVSDVRLRGDFNLENVLAAVAAASAVGGDFASVRRAARHFQGVEHRLEFVAEVRGVKFYNDSKATSVDAAAKALSSFERGVHLILGGKHKGAPYAPLVPLLGGRVREILTIGSAAEIIARELGPHAEIIPAGTLDVAVREAFHRAAPGDTVLLAPACSSYDQFHDFEERGRAFKQQVLHLVREASPPLSLVSESAKIPPSPSAVEMPPEAPAATEKEASEARELEYVFEVSAEEFSRTDLPEAPSPAPLPVFEDFGPAEEPADEPMNYEVRPREDVSRSAATRSAKRRARASSREER